MVISPSVHVHRVGCALFTALVSALVNLAIAIVVYPITGDLRRARVDIGVAIIAVGPGRAAKRLVTRESILIVVAIGIGAAARCRGSKI
jgi:hypothetical protein